MFQKWRDQNGYRHFVLKSNQERHKEWNENQVYVENKDEAMDKQPNTRSLVQMGGELIFFLKEDERCNVGLGIQLMTCTAVAKA